MNDIDAIMFYLNSVTKALNKEITKFEKAKFEKGININIKEYETLEGIAKSKNINDLVYVLMIKFLNGLPETEEILDRIEGLPDQNVNVSATPPSWINTDEELSMIFGNDSFHVFI